MLRRLIRDPLVHFLAIGAAMFGLHAAVRTCHGEAPADARVVVSLGRQATLRDAFRSRSNREPTAEEFGALADAWVREEILVREALRAGLERDDTVIRERLVEKLQFLREAQAELPAPTEADLRRTWEAIAGRTPGEAQMPEEAREAVRSRWFALRRREAEDAAYAALKAKYEIVIEASGKSP